MKNVTRLTQPSLLFMLLALLSPSAWALDVSPMFKVGLDFGGDKIATAQFSNGSTRNITANEGIYIGAGASILNETKNMETEVSLSIKRAMIMGSNGDITWTRYPLDALVFYRLPNVRLGGGITYHMNPALRFSGAAGNGTTQFQNARGLVLQADYGMDNTYLGLRLSSLQYKLSNCPACPAAKSNGAGLELNVRF